MSAWKIIVNWFLPPPLILTILLILPMPAVVKKGLLSFTRNFLFYPLGGQLRLVHLAIIVTGVVFTASAIQTYNLSNVKLAETLTPNQRTALLARRWREERNFWIATLAFLLWGLLYRFYQLMLEHTALRDRVRQLELGAVVAAKGLRAAVAPPATAGKGGAEPSAPPAPLEMMKPPSVAGGDKEGKKAK